MSTWYQITCNVIADDKSSVAKFFNLDPNEDVRTNSFEFSFGGKNGPSLRLGKIIEQNPGLIFINKMSIECDTVQWHVERFSPSTKAHQRILIQDFGSMQNKLSKKALEEYEKSMPGLAIKHLNGVKGYDEFRWSYLFNDFTNVAAKLDKAEEYKELVNPYKYFDIKTYILEYECEYSKEWQKEWQGPYPMDKINALKDKLASYSDVEFKNINVREVEPR